MSSELSLAGAETILIVGDINGDESSDIRDLITLKEIVMNDEYINTADMNADGKIDAIDLVLIRGYLLAAQTCL